MENAPLETRGKLGEAKGGWGVPPCCNGRSPQGNESKRDGRCAVGRRRGRRDNEWLKREGLQVSVGVLSITNLQTVWPVAGVEALGAAEGPNGRRSGRMSRMGRGNTRNGSMRGTIT